MATGENRTDAPGTRPPFMVALGLLPPYSLEDVRRAYFDRALAAHPDRGGSAEEFSKLHEAYTKATEYAGFRTSRMHWLGAWVESYAAQQQVTDRINELGGTVEVEQTTAISESIGADFANVFDRVVSIRLSGQAIDDAVVEYLVAEHKALASLRSLELVGCRLSDAAVARLYVFSNLRRLDLSRTPITYRAIKRLRNLPELSEIKLEGTRVAWWRRLLVGRSLARRTRARAAATPGLPASPNLSLANRD